MKWKLGLCRGLEGLGFPKIRGTILGVAIIRTIVTIVSILGSILGSPNFGKLPYGWLSKVWCLFWIPTILGAAL